LYCPYWMENGGFVLADCGASHSMVTTVSAIEKAFDLARSGQYRSVSEILRHLPREDREIVQTHLMQPNARRELILVCSEAWLATQ
jgi:hypothetical protein